MRWIYLSPHPDDAALSCGGLIACQTRQGLEVEIWTLCAGDPPPGSFSPFAESLHARWQSGEQAPAYRRQEDLESCGRLGAVPRHGRIPDCIYRRSPRSGEFLYSSEESLSRAIHGDELPLVEALRLELARDLAADESTDGVQVVCPLTLGGHVDHRLVRAAAERLERPLLYYADYPYSLKAGPLLAGLARAGWERQVFPLSEAHLLAWEEGVAAHASQISSFWESSQAMRQALRAYSAGMGGAALWKRST